MSGTPGFVYVLSNPSMPGIVKIGRSKRHPEDRAMELYKASSGVPEPFVLEFAVYVKDDHEEAEKLAHDGLHQYRVNGSREFFRVYPEVAVEAIANIALNNFCLITGSEANWICFDVMDRLQSETGEHPMFIKDVLEDITTDELFVLLERGRKRRARVLAEMRGRAHHG